MAPSFFSKLTRSPTHNRERSSTESAVGAGRRSPSPARKRIASILGQTNIPPVPSLSSAANSSPAASSTNVEVTVIPPSPNTSVNDVNGLPAPSAVHGTRNIEGLPSANPDLEINSAKRTTPTSFAPPTFSFGEDDNTPTPTAHKPDTDFNLPVQNVTKSLGSRPTATQTHALASSSSTGNLRHAASEQTSPPTRAIPHPEQKIHKQPSNKSMRSAVNLPPITVAAPPEPKVPEVTVVGADADTVTMTPIVESPTSMEHDKQATASVGDTPTSSTISASSPSTANRTTPATSANTTTNSSPTQNSLWPSPPPRDSDTASTMTKKSKWRRGSNNTRKPTGLASAIAASGLAMANSGITGVSSPPLPILSAGSTSKVSVVARKPTMTGSPPYLGSPPQSSTSHSRGTSQDFSPKRAPASPRRRRRASTTLSTSGHSIDYSDVVYGEDTGNFSGLEDSSADEDDSDSERDLDDFDLDRADIPVTGFAVASNKRNADFHELFPHIPEGDYLIEDYGCALQRDILIQGRLYISENHICFHANIFGWVTDLMIPIYDILTLEKKMTAFVIPNALMISTRQAKYSFASFLARDTTYDVIYNIWRLARPDDATSFMEQNNGSAVASPRGSLEDPNAPASANMVIKKPVMQNKITQCTCGKEGTHYTETALDSVFPGTPDRIYGLIFASGFIKDFMKVDQKLIDVQISDWSPLQAGSKLLARNMSYIKPLTGTFGPKQTKCEIRDETEHCDFDDFVSTVTTTRTPEVPSGGVFSVKTRTCITWASAVTTRVVVTTQVDWTGRSFVKGIIERSAIEGQLQYHGDLDKAMRAYIHEHRSEFVPAGMDPAVMEAAEASPSVEDRTTKVVQDANVSIEGVHKKKNDQRGMQWAWDTFSGAYKVGKQSAVGAIELLKDVWDNSTSTGILYVVIITLVASNIWTIMRVNSSNDAEMAAARRREKERERRGLGGVGMDDKEKWVQGVVTALWEELATGKPNPATAGAVVDAAANVSPPGASLVPAKVEPVVAESVAPPLLDRKDEIQELHAALNAIQERIQMLREGIKELDQVD